MRLNVLKFVERIKPDLFFDKIRFVGHFYASGILTSGTIAPFVRFLLRV
jgi:hypothetical protein